MEFIISFLGNRYFHVLMLITKAVFVDKSTVKTSSSIIFCFKLPKNFIAYSYRRDIALSPGCCFRMPTDVSLAIFSFKVGHFFGT